MPAKPKTPSSKKFLSVADVATRWDVHKQTVYREIIRGRLRKTLIGGSVKFSIDEVERYERVS
jgi:excisionase family DNA binding protein